MKTKGSATTAADQQAALPEEVETHVYYVNRNLRAMITPIKVDKLHELLIKSEFPEKDMNFLIQGFKSGFDIGYEGPKKRKDRSQNIPLRIGNRTILWNKVMKEVKLGHYAGPFDVIPYQNYMQSPIRLIPKVGNKTRLIFHLSYEFKSGLGSLNANTPKQKCSVKYRDLDYAVQCCIKLINILKSMGIVHPTLVFAKSDLTSAFRILPLKIAKFCWLVMYAVDPKINKVHFFVDKCLPFGASISCVLFQKFPDALCHITQFTINKNTINILTNYLDDFLFLAATIWECNKQVLIFLSICKEIGCPV